MAGSAPIKAFADHNLPLVLLVATLLVWAGFMAVVIRDAMLSDAASGTVAAVFPPGRTAHENYTGILRAEGSIVQTTWFDNIWLVRSERAGFVGRLKQQGAWTAFAANSFQPVVLGGCFLAPGRIVSNADAFKTTIRSR